MLDPVVTAVDLFVEGDADHPFASMKRVGGGRWQAYLYGDDPRSREEQSEINTSAEVVDGFVPGARMPGFKDYDTCLAWCSKIAEMVDADPSLVSPAIIHLRNENEAMRLELERLGNTKIVAADVSKVETATSDAEA